jgi:7,8-dihydroneopterin aldolase/epimerase/oxygenase
MNDRLPATSHYAVSARTRGMRVFIEELVVETFVGIHAHEHLDRQPVSLTLELLYGYAPDELDELDESGARSFLDYEQLSNRLRAFLESNPHTRLLEALAIQIAELVFRDYPAAEELVLSLHKPKIRALSKRSGVELCWSRVDFDTHTQRRSH